MNIGIIGRARTGKDTAGKWLVDNRGFRRVAFADALKEAALKVDPIIGTDTDDLVVEGARLGETVRFWGWERAKEIGDTRRFLQELGAAVRDIEEDFWLRAAMRKVMEANDDGVPCVITDVRYPNEAESLKRAGFHLVYIERPGVPQMDHASENSLTADDAEFRIWNDGGMPQLHAAVEALTEHIYACESARHANRL